MRKYKLKILTKRFEEDPKRIIRGVYVGLIESESKKFVSDHIKEIYKSLEIDPATVESVEIE